MMQKLNFYFEKASFLIFNIKESQVLEEIE
jgi:hypothetical protein